MNRVGVFIISIIIAAALVVWFSHMKPVTSPTNSLSPTSSSEPLLSASISPQSPTKTNVTIEGFNYHPVKLVIKKGTTVKWTNLDSVRHDVTSDTGTELSGPLLKQGESYEHTFNTVGTFSYHCTPHPFMKATIEVMQGISD